jgi:cysteine desulfurase
VKLPIYLDHHATTPVDPRVLEAMLPTFTAVFGNAASKTHSFGWQAAEAVDRARAEVARLIGAEAKEVVFTSGATESNNLALRGVAEQLRERGDHVIAAATEHSSVLDVLKALEADGLRITVLPVDAAGLVDPGAVRAAITDRTILVTVMAANNEIGTLAPMAELGAVARERGVLFHTDATQAVGKVPVSVEEWGVGLLSLSAHKLYGPKGAGALYVRSRNPRARLRPQMHGGGHERGLRSGTVNVPGVVGLGRACALAREEMGAEARRLEGLRDRLERGLMERLEGVARNGAQRPLFRLGLHVGEPRAEPRAEGDRGAAGAVPELDPLRARPVDHRGGDRLRDRAGGDRGDEVETALADGEGSLRP